MSVLSLRLAGPLQSWGASARFARRTTEPAPTKSGVIGLLASAQGLDRGDDAGLARLAALRFGVRVDQPGTRVRDFQTAHHQVTGKSMPLSERFYLADAVFVAAVEGDRALIDELHTAVRNPVHLPYLGRRSCPPARPVDLRVHHNAGASLEQVLRDESWQAADWYQRLHSRNQQLTLVVLTEAMPGQGGDVVRDQPVSFATEHRRFALRTVIGTTVPAPTPQGAVPHTAPSHDPFAALEEDLRCT